MCGTLTGSYLGATYGLRRGDRWVRVLFIIVVLAMAIRLLIANGMS